MNIFKLYANLFVMFLVFVLGTNYGFSFIQDEMPELRTCGWLMLSCIPVVFMILANNVFKQLKEIK